MKFEICFNFKILIDTLGSERFIINMFVSYSIHGPGEPQFKVLYEFMRYYSKHGDVRSKYIDNVLLLLIIV